MSSLSRLRNWSKHLLYRSAPTNLYLWLYGKDTDRRVREDPALASGHPGEIMGPKVLAYAKDAGLRPHHHLLDFGCGTMRTGRYLVDYLDSGRYIGVDISRGAIEYSLDLIAKHTILACKRPLVWRVAPYEPLDLPWAPDYILCHSVFTHLPRAAAGRTFSQLRAVMSSATTLLFTAFVDETYRRRNYKTVGYPADVIVDLAARSGIEVSLLDGDWSMRQQVFVGRLTRPRSSAP